MSQTERIQQIVHLLETSRYPVPIGRFLDILEVSRATFKRDIEYLRDRLGAPIEWESGADGKGRGYVLRGRSPGKHDGHYGIQGLWFNQSEIHALLVMHRLTVNMDPGLLSGQAEGLLARITHLLGEAEDDPQEVLARIQVLHSATHRPVLAWFEVTAKATMQQKRLELVYYTRSRNSETTRLISPKRLLHYRENWYLLAWCHTANDLRLFSLDAIRYAQIQKEAARAVARERLDAFVGEGFGIFAGRARHTATLRFSPQSARWIKDETWHPRQKVDWDEDHLVLKVPYSHEAELVMEILRHGPNVEVLSPPELRTAVAEALNGALAHYA